MATLSEELTRLHLYRYSKLAEETAVSQAHADIVITENEVREIVLQEIETTGESIYCPFYKIEDLKNGQIARRDVLRFRMHAVDVLFHAAKYLPKLISEECLTDCEKKFADLNAASQIRIIQIFEILRRKDRLDFLGLVRDQKDRPNAASVVEKDGNYYEKHYRGDNLSDDVHNAAVKAIEHLKSLP